MWDAAELDGDNEGTRGGTGVRLGSVHELLGVVGDEHAEEEDGEDIEEDDTVECQLNRAGDSLSRVLGLADGHTDELGAEIGEGCADEGGPETKEATSVASVHVGFEGAGALPVAETFAVVVGATAEDEDGRENDEGDDGHDFDTCGRVRGHSWITRGGGGGGARTG